MNLTSDLPFWTVRNGLIRVYPAPEEDLRCEVLIVGGGISGALLGHELVKRGIDCILVDRSADNKVLQKGQRCFAKTIPAL